MGEVLGRGGQGADRTSKRERCWGGAAGSGQDLQTGERWWDRRDFSIVSQDEGEENEMGGEEMGKEKC